MAPRRRPRARLGRPGVAASYASPIADPPIAQNGRRRARRRLAAAGAGLALLVLLALAVHDADWLGLGFLAPGASDPFVYREDRRETFESRAAAGYSHVLYAKSPGGAPASAERTARWRRQVEEAAGKADVDPDLLEAMVFLESAGRPDVVAGSGADSAAGLAQILPSTAQDLLGMRADARRSHRLTRAIVRAKRRRDLRRVSRLRSQRRRIDERFDPRKALAGAARYLTIARERLGRGDLAVAAYHMGIGNLESVLDRFGEDDPSYARLYFQSSPSDHSRAYRLLARFGDDSASYYWRVLASREVMRLWREDARKLRRLAALHTAKGSAEEVLHPRSETKVFESPGDLQDGYEEKELRPFPDAREQTGLIRDPRMGSLAARLGVDPTLYRGLRPEAYALALYLARIAEEAGSEGALTVTSTVRDLSYQRALAGRTAEATRGYSLHTTGYAFDVLRRYRSRVQALGFEFALGRLQALNLIAWVREREVIHVTASSEGRLVERLVEEG